MQPLAFKMAICQVQKHTSSIWPRIFHCVLPYISLWELLQAKYEIRAVNVSFAVSINGKEGKNKQWKLLRLYAFISSLFFVLLLGFEVCVVSGMLKVLAILLCFHYGHC